MTEWREATWEEQRDELAAHLVLLTRTLREAGHFPGDVDPEEHSLRLVLNYMSSALDEGGSRSAEQIRRVLGLPHEPPPLTLH